MNTTRCTSFYIIADDVYETTQNFFVTVDTETPNVYINPKSVQLYILDNPNGLCFYLCNTNVINFF